MSLLFSTWTDNKRRASLPWALGILAYQVLAVAGAMFLIPLSIQHVVTSFDEAYEVLGRRAHSPYTPVSWGSVVLAILFMLSWHVWLGRLSYKTTTVEDDGNSLRQGNKARTRQGSVGGSWDRVLGRIIFPFLLLAFALQFSFHVWTKYTSPATMVVPNTVDIRDGPKNAGK